MYKKLYDIKELFVTRNIQNYNINHTFEKGLFFKFSDGKNSREIKNIDYFLISFKKMINILIFQFQVIVVLKESVT